MKRKLYNIGPEVETLLNGLPLHIKLNVPKAKIVREGARRLALELHAAGITAIERKRQECPVCNGQKYVGFANPQKCKACDGRGEI